MKTNPCPLCKFEMLEQDFKPEVDEVCKYCVDEGAMQMELEMPVDYSHFLGNRNNTD